MNRRASFIRTITMKFFVILFALLLVLCGGSDSGAAPPYPPSSVITGVTLHDETARSLAPGSDIWPLSWPADGHQYATFYRTHLP